MSNKLLLHTCCAPCLSSVEEQLRAGYSLDIFWYNPNIYPEHEYERRLSELKRFQEIIDKPLIIHEATNDLEEWTAVTIDFARDPEGQRRCRECISFRLKKTAEFAKNNNYNIFTTTLTVSPHKNSKMVNMIGEKISQELDIPFLQADFKKNNGYLRSVELAKYYGFYRQDYCGCIYSMNESIARALAKEKRAQSLPTSAAASASSAATEASAAARRG